MISLRPLGQHEALRRQAVKLGARCFALSTLRLQALDAGAALVAALRCPRVIATSPAAVRFALAQAPLSRRAGQAWFAPGGGTAASLRRAGIAGVRHPLRGAGAEALLDDPQLQDLDDAPIGLLTAPEGRPLLAQALRARGAKLQVAQVYRREPLAPAAARLRALAALPPRSALLLSSGEALDSLWRSLDTAARAGLRRRPCVASSPRLAAQARKLGLRVLAVAQDARPEHLLAALATQAAAIR